MTPIIENIADFSFRDEVIIDVRTPSEFAEDHFPGAVNLPVLTDDQFKTVGTLYKEKSPFDASKLGAAMVSKNIAVHLQKERQVGLNQVRVMTFANVQLETIKHILELMAILGGTY